MKPKDGSFTLGSGDKISINNFATFNQDQRDQLRATLGFFSEVVNLTFQEVNDVNGGSNIL